MKTILILLSAATMFSCTKDWECCLENKIEGAYGDFEFLNGTSEFCNDFRGTTEEKNQYEEDGTKVIVQEESTLEGGEGSGYTQTLITTCSKD